MNWYEKLNTYFPEAEMKSKDQMEALFSEKRHIYKKEEEPDHIIVYAEFDSFLFIDFLWVSERSRGNGIGRKVMDKLKEKNKTIILEVEPTDPANEDTEKRLRFYKRLEFKHALPIVYHFQAFISGEETPLEILYWWTNDVSDKTIYKYMKTIYEEIHAYKVEKFYGRIPPSVDEVVQFEEKRKLQSLFR